jgi:hypothetical protein
MRLWRCVQSDAPLLLLSAGINSLLAPADQGPIRMPYEWDSVPFYQLQYAVMNQFLMELFGNYDFYTQEYSTPSLLSLNMLRNYRDK